jgi:hypothetical protein
MRVTTLGGSVLLAVSLGLAGASCGDDSSAGSSNGGAGGAGGGGGTSAVGPAGSDAGGGAGAAGASSSWSFTILEGRTVKSLDRDAKIELIRATRPDGVASYLLYAPSPIAPAGPAAVVVMNEPYAGIAWTGEEVDERWAKLGDGLHPDTDAPSPDGDDVIAYQGQTVQQAVDQDLVWHINGFAAVHAYARFYAGGDVAGDVLDAAAAYAFIASRGAAFDPARIGAFGGSWGGMMTLFGARKAPAEARPKALAALTPLSDFVDEYQWTQTDLPKLYRAPADVEAFFSPYWRRAAPSMGRPPEPGAKSEPFTQKGLCVDLPGKVFAPQDDWDLLIPIRQTESLAEACGANIEPLYWRRGPIDYQTVALDHGILGQEPKAPSVYTFAWTFLASALAPEGNAPIVTAGYGPALETFLTTVHEAQLAGRDSGAVLPRLRELAAPRVSLFESDAQAFLPGAEVLAGAINHVWGTSYTADTLRTQLSQGLPMP